MAADQQQKKKSISIARYIASAFVLTAAITVLVTAIAVVVVYNVNRGVIVSDEDLYIALLVAGVIALILSVVLGLFFSSGVVTPIQRISKAAQAIKEGDLSARTGLHGDDELAQLGESFDDMADAIERDRDLERQLIGDVAHELRTPLMAIQATVEAIQDGVFEADDEHMDTISIETRRLSRLVDALLHLNRLENGKTEVKHDPLNLSEVVGELALTHEALIDASGIAFSADIDEQVRVTGDRDLLSQAVANLLSNAVRYTPEGGSINLRVGRRDGYAFVAVTDTGVGISEEDLNKVFSRFWRADGARQSVGGGLGIGLALVKEVVDQHRGNVTVESVLGEGSTFTMNIPLASDDMELTGPVKISRDARKQAKAAKREQDKRRKEQEKLRRLQERQEKSAAASGQQLTLFGIRVPLPTIKKDADEDEK